MKFNFTFKKDDMKDLSLLLANIYLPLLGLIWVCFHLYIRFILKRPFYSFIELKDHISFKVIVFFTIFILIHFFILIISLIILIRRNKKYNTKSIFYRWGTYLTEGLNKLYWKPLEYMHDLVAPHIPGSARFFLYLEKKWQTKRFAYWTISIFDVFPKLIVSIIFFVETIFFHRIYIFIYALMLLFSVFLKIFFTFATRNAPILKEYFESIKGIGDPILNDLGEIVDYPSYEYSIKDEYIDMIDPEEEIGLLNQLSRIVDIVVFTKEALNTITPYILLISSLLYVVGGLFRLIIILF